MENVLLFKFKSRVIKKFVKISISSVKTLYNNWKYFIFFLFLCGIIILTAIFYFKKVTSTYEWCDVGQFGDMFGAFTALFSGFSFAGVIIALIIQHREMIRAAKEHSELKNQVEIMQLDNKFKMLDLFSRDVDSKSDNQRIIENLKHKLSQDLFYNNEYDSIVRPDLLLSQGAWVEGTNSRTLNVRNVGANCIITLLAKNEQSKTFIKNILFPQDNPYRRSTKLLHDDSINIEILNPQFMKEELIYEFVLHGEFVKKVWTQSLTFSLEDNKILVRLGELVVFINHHRHKAGIQLGSDKVHIEI